MEFPLNNKLQNWGHDYSTFRRWHNFHHHRIPRDMLGKLRPDGQNSHGRMSRHRSSHACSPDVVVVHVVFNHLYNVVDCPQRTKRLSLSCSVQQTDCGMSGLFNSIPKRILPQPSNANTLTTTYYTQLIIFSSSIFPRGSSPPPKMNVH